MAAGAEEGSLASEDGGSGSSQTAVGVEAEPSTAEPEAELAVAVAELATACSSVACSSGTGTQAAAEGAPVPVAEVVVIGSAGSSAVSNAATAEEAQDSSSQAAGTFDPGAVPSAAPRTRIPGAAQAANVGAAAAGDLRGKSWCHTWLQHALEQEAMAAHERGTGGSKITANSTRAAGSQTANEPAADPATAPSAAGSSEAPGASFGKGPPTSPALKTWMQLPVSHSPAKTTLGGCSEAASMAAEPAAQEQQPSAAEGNKSDIKTGHEDSSQSAAQSGCGTEAVLPGQRPSRSKRKAGKAKIGRGKRKPGRRRKGASSPAGEATATLVEGGVVGMAAAKDAEPTGSADVAVVGTLPAQQDPAGDKGKTSLTDAQAATLEAATAGGNSRTDQATNCPATGAGHPSGEQQPAMPKEPACNMAKSSTGTIDAAPLRQLTSGSGVADGPAVQCHHRPAGMPDVATLKLLSTGKTGAKGPHHPVATPGSKAGVSTQTTGVVEAEPKVERGLPPWSSMPAPQASISSSALPSGQIWPAGSASGRRAASSERLTWIGRAALSSNILFLLCFLFGGERPLPHNYQAGQDTALAASSGAYHCDSSGDRQSPAAILWAPQTAAAAAEGSPAAFSAAATPAARRAKTPLSLGSTLSQQAGSKAPTAASIATAVALQEQAVMVARSPACADQPRQTSQAPAAAAGQLAGAAPHQAASSAGAEQPAAQAPTQGPAGSLGASRTHLHAKELPAVQLQGTSHLAWSAVPALDASSKAAGVKDAASAISSFLTSSPAVAVQDARSAVAAADGRPPEPAEPAAVQAASSSLGAAVGELNEATVHVAHLSLNQTRSSIVREAHGEVSVLGRHNAWL